MNQRLSIISIIIFIFISGSIYFACDSLYALDGERQPNNQIQFGLSIEPLQDTYTDGDNITVFLDVQAPSVPTRIDLYFVLLDF